MPNLKKKKKSYTDDDVCMDFFYLVTHSLPGMHAQKYPRSSAGRPIPKPKHPQNKSIEDLSRRVLTLLLTLHLRQACLPSSSRSSAGAAGGRDHSVYSFNIPPNFPFTYKSLFVCRPRSSRSSAAWRGWRPIPTDSWPRRRS